MARKVPFPEVVSDLRFVAIFSIFMFIFLIYLGLGEGSVDPVMFYLIMGIYLLVLGINTTEWRKMNDVLGFNVPISGGWLLFIVWGIGFSILFYTLVTYRAVSIFQGTVYMSLIQPLYVPLALPQYSIDLGFSELLAGSAFFYTLVALFEEAYVIIGFKSIANWLSKKGVSLLNSALIAMVTMRGIWAVQHYLSWDGLSLLSISFAVGMGFLFYLPYWILDASGVLSPDKTITFVGIVSLGAVGFHWGYDFWITEGLLIPYNQFMLLGVILTIAPPIAMYFIRRSQEGKKLVPIEFK